MLQDRNATRDRIQAAISDLLAAAEDGSEAVIQFAGHATQLPDPSAKANDRLLSALVPFDYLSAGCISHADLAAMLLPHADRVRITLFFDCSHPGSSVYPVTDSERENAARIPYREGQAAGLRRRYLPLASQPIAAMAARKSPLQGLRSPPTLGALRPASQWVHVAAASKGEFAFESAAGGQFSLAALRHLPRAINEHWLPARFLDAVRSALPTQQVQTPQLLASAGSRSGQAMLGNPPGELGTNGVASVNSLSLRELIRAVDALSAEAAEPDPVEPDPKCR